MPDRAAAALATIVPRNLRPRAMRVPDAVREDGSSPDSGGGGVEAKSWAAKKFAIEAQLILSSS